MNSPPCLQLYSVREHIASDLPGTLKRVADIGYTSVELFNFVDNSGAYAAELPALGLAAPTAHARLVGANTARIFGAAQSIGVQTVIDPHIDDARWGTTEDIAAIAADLNALASVAADYGLKVGYHNHAFEFENRVDGVSALEVLVGSLDDSISLEIDIYWAAVGGEDVESFVRRMGPRVQFLHVKDGPLSKNDKEQVAVGQGNMPIADIISAAPHALRVVELDDFAGDIFDAVADSLVYLNRLNDE